MLNVTGNSRIGKNPHTPLPDLPNKNFPGQNPPPSYNKLPFLKGFVSASFLLLLPAVAVMAAAVAAAGTAVESMETAMETAVAAAAVEISWENNVVEKKIRNQKFRKMFKDFRQIFLVFFPISNFFCFFGAKLIFNIFGS